MENQPTQSGGTVPAVGSDGLLGHLWLVHGSCGEYSDRCEWVVCAYRSEEEAKKHTQLAQARADALKRQYENAWKMPANANEYDPQMQTDYTGTFYSHGMTELRSLP
jgi:hypothetical protein